MTMLLAPSLVLANGLTIHGRRVDLGLGSADLVKLADARKGGLGPLAFPGTRPGAMLGNAVMTQVTLTAGVPHYRRTVALL